MAADRPDLGDVDGPNVGGPDGAEPADPLDVLEAVLRHLGDELAFFRRRALDAERRLRETLAAQLAAAGGVRPRDPADVARIGALEAENAELRGRLADAAERARAVASRLRFARQQDEAAAVDAVG